MGVVEFATYVNEALTPGSYVDGSVVKLFADNGAEVGETILKVIEGGNGTASEVSVEVQAAGASGGIASGMAFLTLDLGVIGAALAPALGFAAGAGLYSLAPDFWTDVSNSLVNAGKTIGGKVIAYWDGSNTYFDAETIEIIKNAMLAYGIFDSTSYVDDEDFPDIELLHRGLRTMAPPADQYLYFIKYPEGEAAGMSIDTHNASIMCTLKNNSEFPQWAGINYILASASAISSYSYTYKNKTVYYIGGSSSYSHQASEYLFPVNYNVGDAFNTYRQEIAWAMVYGNIYTNPELDPDSTKPNANPFPLTYPTWLPYEYPVELPHPEILPDLYPIKYPGVEPNPYPSQQPAQNPDPESAPDIYPKILPDFPLPEPGVTPSPEPEVDPDPGVVDPDPVPDPSDVDVPKDPVDPNPNPTPSSPIVVPSLPATVHSNKLFTVYNPTASQLDALGGYLWDSSIIAAIRDIWQDPMDGLIALQQIFVTPDTSGSHNIILGFLDTGISAAVVSDQFISFDCGMVSIPENKKNATDYAPYTSLHLYLPFIGIVELDTAECMNSNISIVYNVDVYTGTCIAQVKITRSLDMPNSPILYTFSGNCSQQIPLTSGNATGLFTALVGACTVGLSVASGGSLSTLAGAQMLGNSLTHEMAHVTHSGNISANAGILGQKKPYLIIGRRHCYDANNYNSFYGFPANKTINIGNHEGFVRVKVCWLKTDALQEEYEEIMRLLEDGVFI